MACSCITVQERTYRYAIKEEEKVTMCGSQLFPSWDFPQSQSLLLSLCDGSNSPPLVLMLLVKECKNWPDHGRFMAQMLTEGVFPELEIHDEALSSLFIYTIYVYTTWEYPRRGWRVEEALACEFPEMV